MTEYNQTIGNPCNKTNYRIYKVGLTAYNRSSFSWCSLFHKSWTPICISKTIPIQCFERYRGGEEKGKAIAMNPVLLSTILNTLYTSYNDVTSSQLLPCWFTILDLKNFP